MKRIGAVLAACAALAVPFGASGAADGNDATDAAPAADIAYDRVEAELGAELFVRYCASCHGSDGRGEGPVAPALRTAPPDLTRIAARRGGSFPQSEIWSFIDGRFAIAAHGSRAMPVWGERWSERIPEAGVSDEVVRGKIVVLVEYLKSIQVSE